MQDNDTIHIAFQALSEFKKKNSNKLPRPWNRNDAESFVKLAENTNNNLKNPFKDLNKKLLELFASVSAGI